VPRYKTERCEHVRPRDGHKCMNEATFLVGIGLRKFDRQRSCSRHLAATIAKIIAAECSVNPAASGGVIVLNKDATVIWRPKGFPIIQENKEDR